MTKTALLIDENLETLAEAAAIFNLLGHTVTTVTSSEDAIDRLSSWRFNVMLTEASLSKGMDGIALGRVVAKVCFQTKILVGSNRSKDYLREHHGFEDDFILIAKPYSPETIAPYIAASTLPASIAEMGRQPVRPLTLVTGNETLHDLLLSAQEEKTKSESSQE